MDCQSYTNAITLRMFLLTNEIRQYEHVSEDKPISMAFHRMVWINETLKFRTGVVDCDEDDPPEFAGETSGASK